MTDAVLSFQAVSKNFSGLRVVDEVSFDVARGSRTALIGPNGAGKTTVFNLISGVYPIDDGKVLLDGVDITSLPDRERINKGISRSFQNIRLMPHLSAVENVMLGQHARARRLGSLLFPLGVVAWEPLGARGNRCIGPSWSWHLSWRGHRQSSLWRAKADRSRPRDDVRSEGPHAR